MTQRPARGAARLAAILDSLPDALLLIDSRGYVVNANARALDMFETPVGPLVGRSVSVILPDFDRTKAVGRTRRRKERRGERTEPSRATAQRTDGTSFPCDVSTSLLAGTIEEDLLLIVVRALSNDNGVKSELAKQQRQTEMILRAATEAIIGVDADGKIVLANPAAARLLRTKAADLAGKDLHELAHHSLADGSPNPRDTAPLAETLRTGRRQKARETTLWRRDGSSIPVDMATLPVTENDVLAGAIVTYTDRADLQSARVRRDELIHILRRELGRPLRRARTEIARVAASEYGQVSPEAAGALDEIAAGLDRLVRVVGEALEAERSSPDQPAVPSRADALKLVQLAVEAVSSAAESDGIYISVDADPVEIELDEDRFVQALSTVLTSAIRSAPARSTVTVAAKQRGDHLRVVVRGIGTGMPPRITERVHRDDAPIDVGVPVARRLIDQLGGTMTIFSSAADGTSCTIELPLPAAGASKRAASGLPTPAGLPAVTPPAQPALPSEEPVVEIPAARQPAMKSPPVYEPTVTDFAPEPRALVTSPTPAAAPNAAAAPDAPTAPDLPAADVLAPNPPAADPLAAERSAPDLRTTDLRTTDLPTPDLRSAPVLPAGDRSSPDLPATDLPVDLPTVPDLPTAPDLSAAPDLPAAQDVPSQRTVDSPTTLTSLPTVPAPTTLPALPPAVLVWPQPHEATAATLRRKGWQPIPVATPHDLTAYLPKRPSALLVDPLTGPVTRTALQAIRSSAAEAAVPLLVAAGIGEVAADALYGSDPAALLRALTPHGRKNGRPARVLLIEGDAALATTFGARLERRGMEVIHATSESEAVLRAAIMSPDLVVVDLMLTRTSGPGIVDWLRLHDRLPATPLVAYTSSSLTSEAYERLRRGESALFLQGRAETTDVEDRITLLVERMSTTL